MPLTTTPLSGKAARMAAMKDPCGCSCSSGPWRCSFSAAMAAATAALSSAETVTSRAAQMAASALALSATIGSVLPSSACSGLVSIRMTTRALV